MSVDLYSKSAEALKVAKRMADKVDSRNKRKNETKNFGDHIINI